MQAGGIPQVNAEVAKRSFVAIHIAIREGLVRSVHDLSEGGLAVAAAEMAFAGGLGAELRLSQVPIQEQIVRLPDAARLFAESNSRFLCEVQPTKVDRFLGLMEGLPRECVGKVIDEPQLRVHASDAGEPLLLDVAIGSLKKAWQSLLAAW